MSCTINDKKKTMFIHKCSMHCDMPAQTARHDSTTDEYLHKIFFHCTKYFTIVYNAGLSITDNTYGKYWWQIIIIAFYSC